MGSIAEGRVGRQRILKARILGHGSTVAQLPEIKSDDVGLLIGTDTPEMFWSLAERRGGRKEPVARKTLLGWIVLGPVDRSQEDKQVNHARADPLLEQLERQWMVDFPEVADETPFAVAKFKRHKINFKSIKNNDSGYFEL